MTISILRAAALTCALVFAGAAHAAADGAMRFFDPQTRSWIDVGPRTPGGPAGAAVASTAPGTTNPVPRETVPYSGPHPAGTIIVDTSERRLYFVQADGTAIKYGVGVGKAGFQWSGTNRISRKAEWPGWTPPPAMRKRRPGLPVHMEGGPSNPLGARAMYIGATYFRIHGSNEPWSIGQAVSSGCIRMVNEDVIDLYEHVKVGTKVVVQD